MEFYGKAIRAMTDCPPVIFFFAHLTHGAAVLLWQNAIPQNSGALDVLERRCKTEEISGDA